MALDQFKTQILLLHSEQSTLDNLRSGFNDRYTVHCATSGSEALNTLVETPINVIVSAQDLPGMSGLEALREAKKRSPDTIGILLAGSASAGLEAMVGDEEVFQVVRGNVTSGGLLKLVENATRQMRLMALAESANDTAANPDEPVSQHIVMETSENGSTIISDGTGRMPALDPKRVAAAVSIGSRSVDILVLTQDQEFLATIKDSSRGMHTVHYANTLAQADEAIRKHKVGVAVVDAAMVGEKVEQLTQHLRKGSARLVAIVAGRRDDGEMLMDLINRGKVYRFLLKPVSPGRARLAVEASVKHHLEAPEAAFKVKGPGADPAAKTATAPAPAKSSPQAAAKPKIAAKPVPKPAPKPALKPAPKPTPVRRKETASKTPPPSTAPADPPMGSITARDQNSPIEDGLADAFGQNDTSFAETVTGLLSSVTEKFSGGSGAESPGFDSAMSDPTPAGVTDAGTGSGGSIMKDPKVLGLAAAAVAVVAGILFWFMSGSGSEPGNQGITQEAELGTPSFAEANVPFEEEVSTAAAAPDVSAIIDEARLARDAGQIFNPAGSNAIELFTSAVSADPNNSIAVAELDAVLETALGMAESAILASNLDDASAALERVTAADADNARLPFLAAQLSQMQLRTHLDRARGAIREVRFEDAAFALNAARNLGLADATEIETVAAELDAARSEQQVDDVLAQANAKLESGALMSPANDNARYYYELVLSNDPDNTAARQGLSIIASKLVLQAQSEISNGNLNGAETLIADARAADASISEISATTAALENARAAILVERQQAAARAEAERLVEAERQAEAERVAQAERDAKGVLEAEADAEAERIAALEQSATAEPQANDVVGQQQNAAAETNDDASADIPGNGAATNGAITIANRTPDILAATTRSSQANAEPAAAFNVNQNPVAVSSLNRTRYVAPKYPRGAQRRNQSGWVDIIFTVAMDGSVKDVDVRNSEPGETFVASAVKAVEKWEFEAVIENGVLVEKKAGVRMLFALE